MALANVFTRDVDGNIGSKMPVVPETICGLIFDISAQKNIWTQGNGPTLAAKLKDTVLKFEKIEEVEEAGITARTGKNNEREESLDLLEGIPHYHLKQFFDAVGNQGTIYVAFADCSKDWNALVNVQKAAHGLIQQFAVWTEQSLWSAMDPEAPEYTINITKKIEAVAEDMADNYFAPASVVLFANPSKVTTGDSPLTQVDFNKIPTCIDKERYVSVMLTQSTDKAVHDMQAALASTTPVGTAGLTLAALATAHVGENIGWVGKFGLQDYVKGIEFGFGDSAISNGALKNATEYAALSSRQLDILDEKGYNFMREIISDKGTVGINFSDDQTCSDGDYCSIYRNRTIGKSRRLVRAALLPYVNAPVKVNPANGQLSPAQATIYNNLITTVLRSMETAEEISSIGKVTVPLDQNILQNKTLNFSYSLIPLGCSKTIKVTEGLAISR